jgi:alpha-N-arabinofuranosidase
MTTNVRPEHLFGQQSTIRDALVAALTLDTFNRHADKVAMANLAQLVNCIHSLFLADGDRFVRTPSYHVFAMYAAHQGAQAVRTVCSAASVRWADAEKTARAIWGLNGSASLADRRLTLTVTNPHLGEPRETEIAVRGGTVRAARATSLTARDPHEINTFERPDAIVPRPADVAVRGAPLVYTFPPASVTKLELELGG